MSIAIHTILRPNKPGATTNKKTAFKRVKDGLTFHNLL